MPRVPKKACECGCGQSPIAVTRTRSLECEECRCPVRMSRSWLELNGLPGCGCGGRFVPRCLFDAAELEATDVGKAAAAELSARYQEFSLRSENSRKASRKHRVCPSCKVIRGHVARSVDGRESAEACRCGSHALPVARMLLNRVAPVSSRLVDDGIPF
jgi:hypothetical protein